MKKKYFLTLLLLIFFVSNNLFAQCIGTLISGAGTDNQTLCKGGTIIDIRYTVPPGAVVSGLPPGVVSALSNDIITISGTPTAAGLYNYVINYPLCLFPLFPIPNYGTIKVNPRPTANVGLTGPGSICLGETSSIEIVFSGTTPFSGHLMGTSNDPFVVINPTFPVTVTPSATVTYTVSDLFDGTGCAAIASDLTGSAFVFVKPLPPAPAVGTPLRYCVGVTANPLTAPGDSLLWYNPPGNDVAALLPDPNPPATDVAGTTHYLVTQTEDGCESPKAEIIVIVDTIPSAPAVSSPLTYCNAEPPVQLTATGSSLLWYTDATGGTGSVTAPTPATGTNSFYVSQTIGGCESPRAQINVIVNPRPVAHLSLSGPANICDGESSELEISFSGSTGPWYGTLSGGSPFFANDNPYHIAVTPTGAITTYTITSLTDDGTECSAIPTDLTGSETITLGAAVDTPVVTHVDPYCQFEPALPLEATGTDLTWYSSDPNDPGSTTPPIVSTTEAGIDTFYVSQTISGCASPVSAIYVIVKPKPVMTHVDDVKYCNGEQVNGINFTGTPPNDIEFTWHCDHSIGFGTGPVTADNISSFFAQNFSQLSDTSEVIVEIEANGCAGIPDTFNIVVNPSPPRPDFNWFSFGGGGVCSGSEHINFNIIFPAEPVDSVTYLWSTLPLINPNLTIHDVNTANTTISFFTAGIDTIMVLAINPQSIGGCKDSIAHLVGVTDGTFGGIQKRKILKKQPGNLLIYPDNSIQGYQWGFDALIQTTPDVSYGPPVNIDGQVYQFFIPEQRFINSGNELDTFNYAFWVLLRQGECFTRVYYNGPNATGRMIDVSQQDDTPQLNLFPNPNNGIFDVVLKGDIYGSIDARIYNAMGQLVLTDKFSKTTWEMHKKFNAGKLPAGVYYLVTRSSDLKKFTSRFIIQQ